MILSARRSFAIVLLLLNVAPAAKAAELVMFESASCVWCDRWHEEIGSIYPKTDEARCAPLRRVDIDDPRPAELNAINPIIYTPTFVLVHEGQEVSRLVGYPGEDFFWPLLDRELVKLPEPCPN